MLKAILPIDENAITWDQNDKECTNIGNIPDGHEYTQRFIIDNDDRLGITHVQYKITSKHSVSELKYDTMNLFQFLKSNSIFVQYQKFKAVKEATIGYLSYFHPDGTLKSDL